VKEECAEELTHCSATNLKGYMPGTTVPVPEGIGSIDPGDKGPKDTRSRSPLIVVAPQQQQQQSVIDNDLLRGVKRALEGHQDATRPTPIQTPASIGDATIDELKRRKLVQKMSGTTGQPAVLNAEQHAEL
jgi:hypothetical protein